MLNITSFNCHSIRNNLHVVLELMKNHDIILLQELMLREDDIDFYSNINLNFNFIADVKDSIVSGIINGRPARGVSIMWSGWLSKYIETAKVNDRIISITIKHEKNSILIINSYMPYDARDIHSFRDYKTCLSIINDLIANTNCSDVIICGDLNADHIKNTRFWKEIEDFMLDNDLKHVIGALSNNDFTYVCPATGSTSYLDHVICTPGIYHKLLDLNILYELSTYDHFPIEFKINLNLIQADKKEIYVEKSFCTYIDWNLLSKNDIDLYKDRINSALTARIDVFNNFNSCNHQCDKVNCKKILDSIFNFLLWVLIYASSSYRKNHKPFKKFKVVPGWNDSVKSLYKTSKDRFFKWKSSGRKKGCKAYHDMVCARRKFKRALKSCRKNEEKIRNEKIANCLSKNNSKGFWKEIKKVKGSNFSRPYKIGSEIDGKNTSELFSEYFKKTFAKNNTLNDDNLNYKSDLIKDGNYINLTNCDIKNAINKLKPYCDIHNISSSHLKNCPDTFISFLTKFLNYCIRHGYLPCKFTEGVISPRLKNKFLDSNTLTNYRPIVHSSLFFRIIEHIILKRLQKYFKFNDNQHGFQSKLSTFTACFSLKETVFNYFLKDTPVYAAFLDYSKAFDNINYKILFNKLHDKGVPNNLLNFIHNFYIKQYVRVNFEGEFSSSWKLLNGVRQGGVLSPFFFNLYLDSLLDLISSSKVGCRLGFFSNNIIAYADDVVLLAPSVSGLQTLINITLEHSNFLKLTFNSNKSYVMKFTKFLSDQTDFNIFLDDVKLKVVNSVKYLGFDLNYNLTSKYDIIRERNRFYNSFNSIFRKFYNIDINSFMVLFKSYCMQFYGSCLWFNNKHCKIALKQFSVGYHKALKKILNVPWSERNHIVCWHLGILHFKDYINMNRLRFVFKIFNDSPPFLRKNYSYYVLNSVMLKETNIFMIDEYDVMNFLDNDIEALYSRINHVHNMYIFN